MDLPTTERKPAIRTQDSVFYRAYNAIETVVSFKSIWDIPDYYRNDKIKIKLKAGQFAKCWEPYADRMSILLGTGFGIVIVYEDNFNNKFHFNVILPEKIKSMRIVNTNLYSDFSESDVERILGHWSDSRIVPNGCGNLSQWLEYMYFSFKNHYKVKTT